MIWSFTNNDLNLLQDKVADARIRNAINAINAIQMASARDLQSQRQAEFTKAVFDFLWREDVWRENDHVRQEICELLWNMSPAWFLSSLIDKISSSANDYGLSKQTWSAEAAKVKSVCADFFDTPAATLGGKISELKLKINTAKSAQSYGRSPRTFARKCLDPALGCLKFFPDQEKADQATADQAKKSSELLSLGLMKNLHCRPTAEEKSRYLAFARMSYNGLNGEDKQRVVTFAATSQPTQDLLQHVDDAMRDAIKHDNQVLELSRSFDSQLARFYPGVHLVLPQADARNNSGWDQLRADIERKQRGQERLKADCARAKRVQQRLMRSEWSEIITLAVTDDIPKLEALLSLVEAGTTNAGDFETALVYLKQRLETVSRHEKFPAFVMSVLNRVKAQGLAFDDEAQLYGVARVLGASEEDVKQPVSALDFILKKLKAVPYNPRAADDVLHLSQEVIAKFVRDDTKSAEVKVASVADKSASVAPQVKQEVNKYIDARSGRYKLLFGEVPAKKKLARDLESIVADWPKNIRIDSGDETLRTALGKMKQLQDWKSRASKYAKHTNQNKTFMFDAVIDIADQTIQVLEQDLLARAQLIAEKLIDSGSPQEWNKHAASLVRIEKALGESRVDSEKMAKEMLATDAWREIKVEGSQSHGAIGAALSFNKKWNNEGRLAKLSAVTREKSKLGSVVPVVISGSTVSDLMLECKNQGRTDYERVLATLLLVKEVQDRPYHEVSSILPELVELLYSAAGKVGCLSDGRKDYLREELKSLEKEDNSALDLAGRMRDLTNNLPGSLTEKIKNEAMVKVFSNLEQQNDKLAALSAINVPEAFLQNYGTGQADVVAEVTLSQIIDGTVVVSAGSQLQVRQGERELTAEKVIEAIALMDAADNTVSDDVFKKLCDDDVRCLIASLDSQGARHARLSKGLDRIYKDIVELRKRQHSVALCEAELALHNQCYGGVYENGEEGSDEKIAFDKFIALTTRLRTDRDEIPGLRGKCNQIDVEKQREKLGNIQNKSKEASKGLLEKVMSNSGSLSEGARKDVAKAYKELCLGSSKVSEIDRIKAEKKELIGKYAALIDGAAEVLGTKLSEEQAEQCKGAHTIPAMRQGCLDIVTTYETDEAARQAVPATEATKPKKTTKRKRVAVRVAVIEEPGNDAEQRQAEEAQRQAEEKAEVINKLSRFSALELNPLYDYKRGRTNDLLNEESDVDKTIVDSLVKAEVTRLAALSQSSESKVVVDGVVRSLDTLRPYVSQDSVKNPGEQLNRPVSSAVLVRHLVEHLLYSKLKKETDSTFDNVGHLPACLENLHHQLDDGKDNPRSKQLRTTMRDAVTVLDRLLPADSPTMRTVLERFIDERALCVKIDSKCKKGEFDKGFLALLQEGNHRKTAQTHFSRKLQHVGSLPGCFIKACADKPELLQLLTDGVLTAEAIEKLKSAAEEYITQKMGQPGADLEALVDHSFITQFGLQDLQAPIAEQYIRQKMHEPDANLEALVDHSFIAQFDLQDLQAKIHQYQEALAAIQGMEVVGAGGDQRADLDNLLSKAENLRELMGKCSRLDTRIPEVVKEECRQKMGEIMVGVVQAIADKNKDIGKHALVSFQAVCRECGFNDLEDACEHFLDQVNKAPIEGERSRSPDSVITEFTTTTPSSGYKDSRAGEQQQRRASSRGGVFTEQCGYGGQRFASVSTPTMFHQRQDAGRQEKQSPRELVQQLKVLGF